MRDVWYVVMTIISVYMEILSVRMSYGFSVGQLDVVRSLLLSGVQFAALLYGRTGEDL